MPVSLLLADPTRRNTDHARGVAFRQCFLLFSDFVVCVFVIDHEHILGILHILLFNMICGLALVSHAVCMFSDPGTVPLVPEEVCQAVNTAERPRKKTTCYKHCLNPNKPPGAHHCGVCKRCVMKMDHHCPWVNNCVGENNQKHFLLFLIYTFTLCVYAMLLIIARGVMCSNASWDGCEGFLGHSGLVISVVAIALLFGLLTILICSDQISSIARGGTPIDRLKGIKVEAPPSCWVGLEAVCGEKMGVRWLLPVPRGEVPDSGDGMEAEPFVQDEAPEEDVEMGKL